MRKFKLFFLTLVALLGGVNYALAVKYDRITPYSVDFNEKIAVPSNNHSEPIFTVSAGWTRIADRKDGDGWYGTAGYYMLYSYETSKGVDGSGALYAKAQKAPQSSYDGTIESTNDYIVTPKVSGTVTLMVKGSTEAESSYPAGISFFKVDDDATTVGDALEVEFSEDINTSDYVTATITLTEDTRIAIRAQFVYMDNFTATSADIPEIRALSITSVEAVDEKVSGNYYYNAKPDGTFTISYSIVVKNTGNATLTVGDEDYSVFAFLSGSESTKYSENYPVPVTLEPGETSEPFQIDFSFPSTAISSSGWGTYNVKENVSSTTGSGVYCNIVAYESKFVFRAAESTSTSSISTPESWGTITESTSKSFEIYNDGTAPLTLKSITLPDGFTSDDLPEIPEEGLVIEGKGKTEAFTITQDASAKGTFAGNLVVSYLTYGAEEATNYSLAFSATVIGENTWTADFNNTSSTVLYPAGAVAENGINTSYQYISSQNYNNWIIGRTQSSYATENNKFITPKLHAVAGDKLTFDVKGAYGTDYYARVYVSTDRKTWGEPVAYYTYSETEGAEAIGSSDWQTKTITFDEAGDYYVAFALYGTFAIDNIVGLEKVDVAHDLYIKSVNWPDASVKTGIALSKPSVEIIPLTDEAAENYTVKYVYGDNEVVIDSKALTASASSTTTFAASFTPEVETNTTYEGTKVVFEFTDGTTFETETFDLTVTNEPQFYFLSSKHTSRYYAPSSNYAGPIAFGKTNSEDSKTFYILNWGTAPLTVKSIAAPTGFTPSVSEMTVAAFDGTSDGLETAQQSFDVTFTATEAGTYSGNLVITYVDGNGDDQQYEVPVSGTKLDPTKWYANFGSENNKWPVGSVYQSNVSTTYVASGDYAITSSSTTNNLFITPKLVAAAGEKLTFDAKLYSSSWPEGKVVVWAAATRDDLLDTEKGDRKELFSVSGKDEENPMTTDYQTFEVTIPEAGEYYLGFEISGRPYVDEIYGLKMAEVEHDFFVASYDIPAEAMQNVQTTAKVNIANIGLAAESDLTVTVYVDDKAVATLTPDVVIPTVNSLAATGTAISVPFRYGVAGTFPVYIEVKAGDYKVFTAPAVDVNFTGEIASANGIQVGTQTSTGRDYGFVDWYNNDGSATRYTDILYTAAKISAAGIKAGDKIQSISFKASNSAKTFKAVVTSWVGTSTGDITYGSPAKDDMQEVVVYNGSVEFPANFESVITLPEPIVWDGESDIRVYTEAVGQGNSNWISATYAYDTDITMSYNGTTKAGPVAYFTLAVESATYAGRVLDAADDSAIEGATVTLVSNDGDGVQYSGTTDAEGNYSFNIIQSTRDYVATVTVPHFSTVENDAVISFSEGSVVADDVKLGLTIDESEPLIDVLSKNYVVTLKRTFNAGFNTVVLPFALNTALLSTSAKVYAFTGYNNGALEFTKVDAMEANVPYILYLTEAKAFDQVIPAPVAVAAPESNSVAQGAVTFQGNYDGIISAQGKYGVNNAEAKLSLGGANATMKGYRAYFEVEAGAKLNGLSLSDNTTGIRRISAESLNGDVYTLDGRKVNSGEQLRRGVYIVNGQKVVIK